MGPATRRVLIAIVLFLGTGTAAPAQESGAPIGYIAAIDGAGVIVRAGQSMAIMEGAVVTGEDQIETEPMTQVLLVLNDGGRVIVGPETRIAMTLLATAEGGSAGDKVIDLLQGILRINVHQVEDGGAVQTRTPTAVVAARSTAWIVQYDEEDTAVLALEGTVDVTATTATGAVTLSPGFGTDVLRGMAPRDPVEWGAARAEDFRARTAFSGVR